MKDFIYSIQDVFNTKSGCLFHYKVNGYYIASYQRGYKWKSNSVYDQVPVLLLDVYEAFIKAQTTQSQQEYYLQYITVKKTEQNQFEVIDGQQRLTTLTLIFSVLEQFFNQENITKYKKQYLVTYSRYDEESVSIFDTIIDLIINNQEAESLKEQDKFYMLKAVESIKYFFSLLKEDSEENFNAFLIYFKNSVKLILNIEDEHTSAEEVFANLNDNKVPLTNAYLIKGLLLTKASRLQSNQSSKKHFKEIIDQRAIMGRLWDEMNTWFSKPDVSLFFFGTTQDGMEKMLQLVSFDTENHDASVIQNYKAFFSDNTVQYKNPYILFNTYHQHIITTLDAAKYLNQIEHIYKRLKSWYYDNQFYNLIGYKQVVSNYKAKSSEGFSNNIKDLLSESSNAKVLENLQKFVLEKINKSTDDIVKLGYKKYDETFFLLLAINVFPQNHTTKGNFRNYRFDFYSFIDEEWSLEHIFPQKPNASNLDVKDDKDWVIQKIQEKINALPVSEENQLSRDNYKALIQDVQTSEEIDTTKIDFLFDEIEDVDVLGNMALLSSGVNSALSNGFFNTKRKILLRKINAGSFVPKHTIDVFSKMLKVKANVTFDNSLTVWSSNDINAHLESIKENVELMINKLEVVQ